MGVGGQYHALATLPPGKTRYSLYKRKGGYWGRSGRVRKISPPTEFDPRNAQAVVSRYTDYAILAPGKILLLMGDGHIKISFVGQQRNR
jgi:hypothetical protein